MKGITRLMLATLAGLSLLTPAQAADPYIRLIASTCINCHGPNGVGMGAVPALAGQDKDYLVQAMLEQKAGTRETTVMRRYMNGYTEQEMVKLAEYFNNIK